jgi:chaperonin GroES
MQLKPLHDWAVIRPSDAEEITAGGLYIPDTAKDKPQEGVVEAIGPGAYIEEKGKKKKEENKERRFVPTIVRPGDRVIYERYAGQSYKIGSDERILVRERDILGILPERQTPRPKPLQIPSSTTATGPSALVKPAQEERVRPTPPPGGTKTARKPASKAASKKKAGKKAVKKTAGKARATKSVAKPVRKSKIKKSPARKTGKKK